jgi:hypothetical protein
MLRDEENAKYRSVLKNTLEFDPDIMKRYVNFMSNPDERTAIDQFGKGDKCFGVATMMATLPGLPMFGHGQIEGFTEKYGMEYYRPRYEEWADQGLVERHQREIAPLLQRRRLFAESNDFLLYDFFQPSGAVDENVFAYSNRRGAESALVVYNNRYGSTHGTIDYSAAYADKASGGLRQKRLAEGLGLSGASDLILAWRDTHAGLEYLRHASDIAQHGLTFDLNAYQCRVLLDWRELRSSAEHPWDRLCEMLNGQGVPSLDDALVNLELRPVHDALRYQFDPALLRQLIELAEAPLAKERVRLKSKEFQTHAEGVYVQAWFHFESFLRTAQSAYLKRISDEERKRLTPAPPLAMGQAFRDRLSAALAVPTAESHFPDPWTVAARRILPSASPHLASNALWGPVLGWCALALLAESIDPENPQCRALDIFDRLRLREPLAQSFAALGLEGEAAWRAAARIKVLLLAACGLGEIAPPQPEEPEETAPATESASIALEETASLAEEAPIEDEEALSALDLEADSPEASEDTVDSSEPVELPESEEVKAASEPAPSLWQDPDLRWLTGVHEAKGHSYLVREPYEELLWWLLLPALLRLPADPVASRAEAAEMQAGITASLAAAEASGYRLDRFTGNTLKV